MAYLYGASIQGIQGFIFESNELRNIIGASEIVKKFDEIIFLQEPFNCKGEIEILLQAAGNIRLKISDKSDAETIVKLFPKYIMQMAYGITVSQALVNEKKELARELLESNIKVQRNRVSMPLDYSNNLMTLEGTSGRAIDAKEGKGVALLEKEKAYLKFEEKNQGYENQISKLSNKESKIAIIHADGNGLGDIVRHYIGDDMASFSKDLNEATSQAFKRAKKVFPQNGDKIYREVILGGDDLTFICHADYALVFTQSYLKFFQEETKTALAKYKKSIRLDEYTGELTACAGIAYCNEKYPFYMAVELAEDLCKYAKEKSGRKNSCLMFHNIQDSYYENYNLIIDRELTAKVDNESDIYLNYGPYYLDSHTNPSINGLMSLFNMFRKENSPLSRLREWIEELQNSRENAKTLLKDIEENSKTSGWEGAYSEYLQDKDGERKTQIHDILQLHAVTQEIIATKEDTDAKI